MNDKSLEQHKTAFSTIMEKFKSAIPGEAIHLTPDEAQTMRTEGVLQAGKAQQFGLNRAQRRRLNRNG